MISEARWRKTEEPLKKIEKTTYYWKNFTSRVNFNNQPKFELKQAFTIFCVQKDQNRTDKFLDRTRPLKREFPGYLLLAKGKRKSKNFGSTLKKPAPKLKYYPHATYLRETESSTQ